MSTELEQAKALLESYKLVSLKIRKTGSPTEQNPMPFNDLLNAKSYEFTLEKEYLVPQYMVADDGPVQAAYTPRYEGSVNEAGEMEEFKSMHKIGVNVVSKAIPDDTAKYLKDNPQCQLMFSVDKKELARVEDLIKELSSGKGKSKAKADADL